jgi:hypothetical protein
VLAGIRLFLKLFKVNHSLAYFVSWSVMTEKSVTTLILAAKVIKLFSINNVEIS